MTLSEATLKFRVFNFLQNQIIYFIPGDSLGVPNRYALFVGTLSGLCQKMMQHVFFMCCTFMDSEVYSADAPGSTAVPRKI